MKIFLINPSPGEVGGISSHLANLSSRLRDNRIPHQNIAITACGGSKRGPLSTLLNLMRGLFKTPNRREAILHFHTSKKALPFLFAILPLWLLRKNSIVLSIHSGQYMEWLDINPVYRFLHYRLLPLASKVVFMNEVQAEQFRLVFPLMRVDWSPPFIAARLVPSERKTVASLHHPFRLVGSGMWAGYYRHEDLIDAAACVSARLSIPIVLTMVVGTPQRGYGLPGSNYRADRIQSE